MAAFTHEDPHDRVAFDAHWAKCVADPTIRIRSIEYENDVVGHVARFERDGVPEVTYWIDKVHWGKGIASAALATFLAEESTRPIYGCAASDNLASIRVLEKCGFVHVKSESGFANARGKEIEEVFMELK